MVICGHKKKHLEYQVKVHIEEALLHKQDSVKFLGVTVDKQLSWKSHIANVRRICLGKIASIRRSSVYLPKQVRKMLYLSVFIPHLDYCSVVWHNCGVVLTSGVERIQNYALRVILKKTSRSDTKEMRSQLSLPTLEHRRLTSTLLQGHRCLHGHAPEYLSHKFVSKDSLFANYPATRGVTNLHLKHPRTNAYKSTYLWIF